MRDRHLVGDPRDSPAPTPKSPPKLKPTSAPASQPITTLAILIRIKLGNFSHLAGKLQDLHLTDTLHFASSHLCNNNIYRSTSAMRPLTSSAGTALRTWTRHALPPSSAARLIATPNLQSTTSTSLTSSSSSPTTHLQQRRHQGGSSGAPAAESSFDSPFGRTSEAEPVTTKIPNFKPYMSSGKETTNRVFQYFVVGTMGILSAAGAKATVQGESRQGEDSCGR